MMETIHNWLVALDHIGLADIAVVVLFVGIIGGLFALWVVKGGQRDNEARQAAEQERPHPLD